jgi:crossover junction endodeoxyribonuclease RusA
MPLPPDDRGEVRVVLPWPNKLLSPNARAHHFARSRAAKKAREQAWALTLEALHGNRPSWAGVTLAWRFCPPSHRRYDEDNLIAQHKAAQDGIADALGIDDSKFNTTRTMGSPVKGGSVEVTIARAG